MKAIAEAEPTAFRTEGEREAASEQAKRNVVKCATFENVGFKMQIKIRPLIW